MVRWLRHPSPSPLSTRTDHFTKRPLRRAFCFPAFAVTLCRGAAFPFFGLGAEVPGAGLKLADGEAGFAQQLDGAGDESAEGEYASGEGENFQRADQAERVECFRGETGGAREVWRVRRLPWRSRRRAGRG